MLVGFGASVVVGLPDGQDRGLRCRGVGEGAELDVDGMRQVPGGVLTVLPDVEHRPVPDPTGSYQRDRRDRTPAAVQAGRPPSSSPTRV